MGTPHCKNRTTKSTSGNTIKVDVAAVANWLDAINETIVDCPDDIPEGWYSMKALSSMLGKSLSTTNRKVSAMVSTGKAVSKNYRIIINGRLKVVPYYKLKEDDKK